MYLHIFFSSDGSVFFIVQSPTQNKKKAFEALVKSFKRKNGSKDAELMFGSPPQYDLNKIKVKKLGTKMKRLL